MIFLIKCGFLPQCDIPIVVVKSISPMIKKLPKTPLFCKITVTIANRDKNSVSHIFKASRQVVQVFLQM